MFARLKGLGLGAAFAVLAGTAGAQTYSVEGAAPGSLTGIVPQSLAQYVSDAGIDLQVVLGQTLTRSALNVAAGRLDMAVIPPPAYGAMTRGAGPYEDQGDTARELSGNIRTLFGFPGGTFHTIVWADSGIENWEDIAGKRVYVGPPAGAANAQIRGMVEQASGYIGDEDYEAMRAPWGAAQQSFQDGQYDVYIAAAAVGQQSINELSLVRPIRILGVPDDVVDSAAWEAFLEDAALSTAPIPAETYAGQVNNDEDLRTAVTMMMMGVHKDFDEEHAYQVARAYWENLPEMKAGNALMRTIDESDPFAGLNAPLHPGAARYFTEAGFDVPEHLIAD